MLCPTSGTGEEAEEGGEEGDEACGGPRGTESRALTARRWSRREGGHGEQKAP